MILHSVLISYNRRELTERAIQSYLETVSVAYTVCIVDNGSGDETRGWLDSLSGPDSPVRQIVMLDENRYPGYACNFGFDIAPAGTTHLHRLDNDFVFLPGWCEELQLAFKDPRVGQVGLRTNAEEMHATNNVGGNMAVRRELWDAGLRYDERPWPELAEQVGPGWTEDSFLSPAVEKMGWKWRRVRKPCIVPISPEHTTDPYYVKSWADRGIVPPGT